MSKLLKAAVAFACLICVLAIFIAPTVDMPETVLRHHTVRTTVLQALVAFALATGSAVTVPHESLGSRRASSGTQAAGAVSRKRSFVMRC